MIGYTDAPQAWTRAQRMSQAAGLNLAAAVVDGWLDRRELGAIVETCRACAAGRSCDNWLDDLEIATAPLPGFCRNRLVIRALAPC